ncbi:hypothetical protein P872_05690 [Rhodonellum psychrophilum GCM71 = DSM 17998]|uniref:Uncharacterized protein n=1 Tax=Rhodonellum psychrophilum GCM71 = DSM 17998 TaxID=1123057 RepID=U5C0S0_9BACT|nr:hypothetical protein P872_05690 [Rhodonellum psychrophilum GCM71 = DSM 17998]
MEIEKNKKRKKNGLGILSFLNFTIIIGGYFNFNNTSPSEIFKSIGQR